MRYADFHRQRGFGTLLAYGIVAVIALGFVAGLAWKVRQAGYDAAKLECAQAAAAQRDREAQRAAKAAKELEDAQAKRTVVYRRVVKEVDRIVVELRDAPCFNADSVRAVNNLVSGKITDPAKSDSPLPATTDAPGWSSGQRAALGGADSGELPDLR